MDSIKLFLILIIIIVILHKCFNKEEFIVQDKTHKNNVKKCCKGNNCNDKPKYLNENCEENKENAKKSLNKHFKYPSQDCNVENFSINLTNPAIENIHDNLESEEMRFIATGTGMFSGQQSSQLLFMETHHRETLDKAKTAFHCKDWIYYKLTGIKATDPSESCFTFGNFRTQEYDDNVINGLGLSKRRNLLPQIINGTKTHHSLKSSCRIIRSQIGYTLVLSYIDAVCTFLEVGDMK